MTELNVKDFGAIGDGIADDTGAIQAAIDKGGELGLPVRFPGGRYSVGELTLRHGSVLVAEPTWGFREYGKTQILQRFPEQRCVLNLSEAFSATLNGLSLVGLGRDAGGSCCGILSRKEKQAHMEDTYRLERLRSSNFAGDGCRFVRPWCFTVRHCMFSHNGGDGFHLQNGFDGFILDTWFSGNRGCGYGTSGENNAVTMSGCRVEWNAGGGIVIRGGSHYQLTGNYIDRSGKQAILITTGEWEGKTIYSNTISATGNILYRSGKFAGEDPRDSAHIAVEQAAGVTVMGNTLCVGRDDGGDGRLSPRTGIMVTGCRYTVVSGNTMFAAALDNLLVAKDNRDTIIENNPGSLFDRELAALPNLPSTSAVTRLFEEA
ncbi:MAG: right-handed parallel beta-helix repeat-containing protein [Clostridia bacterium]|nr:right-handed parallel beta-helix repeat-containing protein [Clostridia bacterium]